MSKFSWRLNVCDEKDPLQHALIIHGPARVFWLCANRLPSVCCASMALIGGERQRQLKQRRKRIWNDRWKVIKSDNEARMQVTETQAFSQLSTADEETESEQLLKTSHHFFLMLFYNAILFSLVQSFVFFFHQKIFFFRLYLFFYGCWKLSTCLQSS